MDNLKITKFDLDKIPSNSVVLVVGKRGTGKTTLTADIMYTLRKKFHAGICFSSTEESNSYWAKHICDSMIYSDFDQGIYENFIKEQRRINSKLEKPINTFALFEDTMYAKTLRNNKEIRGSFFNGRHWNLFLIVTMQYVLDLPPELRSNVDFIFVLRNNVICDKEKIWKHFAGFVPSFQLFQKIFNKCTNGYECLVISNMSKSNDIGDCLFWYEAKIRNKFKVGRKSMWIYHHAMKKMTDEEEDDRDERVDRIQSTKAKDIVVRKTN